MIFPYPFFAASRTNSVFKIYNKFHYSTQMYKIEYQRVGSHMTEIILPYYIYMIYILDLPIEMDIREKVKLAGRFA